MHCADLLILLAAAPYQPAAFPFAALFHHLCALGCHSLTAQYMVITPAAVPRVLGFRPEAGQGDLSLRNLWMLETTHRLAVFTRTWNKSMSRWLRRLAFQRCPAQPLLATFAFSAWWHGLRPGQVFGFLCWAVMVEADYCIHPFLSAWATSQGVKLFYHGTTSVFTQLIVAYIAVAVETESFSMLCLFWTSCNGILPLSYGLALLLLLAKKPRQN
ncbi:membrane-bound ghrelin O-acyltransferase MBOAT4 [Opisthocomus hoazin]|uniref:membrane-bound ghrelin O-acyltransferase MBOAT4 n=1 Tax=Opisthocomus hoazin TaxID=30419 RepID=UPI003F537743